LSKRALAIGLGIVAGAFALVGLGCAVFGPMVGGHSLYVVSGRATLLPSAVAHAQLPALVCSGRGGPIESSGVYGEFLGRSLERPPQVICSTTTTSVDLEYQESVYYNQLPRQMHVYVWLEPHPELEKQCQGAQSSLISVAWGDLRGQGSDNPVERPCFAPDKTGSLGYAVAFRTASGDRESHDITVKPRGYP
jgi:hypothetical protein